MKWGAALFHWSYTTGLSSRRWFSCRQRYNFSSRSRIAHCAPFLSFFRWKCVCQELILFSFVVELARAHVIQSSFSYCQQHNFSRSVLLRLETQNMIHIFLQWDTAASVWIFYFSSEFNPKTWSVSRFLCLVREPLVSNGSCEQQRE